MAWNEPGKGNNRDPWGNKGGGQQPPDLDEIIGKMQRKISQLFGGRKSTGSSSTSGGLGLGFFLVLFVIVYAVAGFYIVRPAEQAAVFQFGKYQETVGPGPHWIPRLIQSKIIVNVEEVSTSHHEAHMLTKDENIVSVELGVQYKIGDLEHYLFNVKNPELTLAQVTDSAVRQVVGHSKLDDILTSGREVIRQQIRDEIVRILDEYKAGLAVVDVPMQPAKAPEAVKEAFDDAIKAQEDEVRSINRARAYEKQKVPIAQGNAQRRLSEAEAYKADVVLQARGDADRFLKILPEYEQAPVVTRQRLYLDAMSSVLTRSSKIVVDSAGKNNSLFYIPLDKILDKKASNAEQGSTLGRVVESLPDFSSDVSRSERGRNTDIARKVTNRWDTNNVRSRENYARAGG